MLKAEGSPDPFPAAVDDEDQTISINYTNGTTGRPKDGYPPMQAQCIGGLAHKPTAREFYATLNSHNR